LIIEPFFCSINATFVVAKKDIDFNNNSNNKQQQQTNNREGVCEVQQV